MHSVQLKPWEAATIELWQQHGGLLAVDATSGLRIHVRNLRMRVDTVRLSCRSSKKAEKSRMITNHGEKEVGAEGHIIDFF